MRAEIRRLVCSLVPLDATENGDIAFTLKWIDSGVEIFRLQKPSTPETHLVSYFAVTSPDRSHLLLVDHRKAGLWLPPGGHVEPGEHPKTTVAREAREELGIDARFLSDEPIFLTVRKTVGDGLSHTDVSLWYVLELDSCTDLCFDGTEFAQIHWFDLDQIPVDRTDPNLERFIRKLRASISCTNS